MRPCLLLILLSTGCALPGTLDTTISSVVLGGIPTKPKTFTPSGNPRVDKAWTKVASLYGEEAKLVSAIKLSSPHHNAEGWVDWGTTVIILDATIIPGMTDLHLERLLAHELTHVVQGFDTNMMHRLQREAQTREEAYLLQRTVDLLTQRVKALERGK